MTLPPLSPPTGLVRPPWFPSAALLLLLLTAGPVWSADTRSFERVKLLEEKGVTSASVSLGDIDRNGTLDIVLAAGAGAIGVKLGKPLRDGVGPAGVAIDDRIEIGSGGVSYSQLGAIVIAATVG